MSASGATAPLIVSIPNIRIANPRRILPISFFLELSLQVIVIIIPITASTGENDDGFKRLIHPAPLIPVSDNIHEVTVVPILAPIIIPTACESCIIPELTKPTTITVVADDDCITAVTAIPSNTAIILLEVSFSSICSNLPPDSFAKESPMTFIPYKNKASPPAIVSTPKIFILHKLLFERLFHRSCVF